MIDTVLLWRATLVGTVLQIAVVVLGHFIPFISLHASLFAAMFIAGLAGLFYARDLDRGWALGTLGSVIAGTAGALIGIALSVAIGDKPASLIRFVIVASLLSSAAGGPFGQMAANMRAAALDLRRPRGRDR
jgi:uncharacterized membrane protein YeaQ/YmgE (transglycosylase-associated protein family)